MGYFYPSAVCAWIFSFFGGMTMPTELSFYLTSIGLGFALAMDAFSVSLANGLNEPCMRERKMCGIAGMFAFFQALMPMLGWVLVHTLVEVFSVFEKFIPWIALALLAYIGIKMLVEGLKNEDECPCSQKGLGFAALVVQGIATSIDALSTGFTIATYNWMAALLCALDYCADKLKAQRKVKRLESLNAEYEMRIAELEEELEELKKSNG